MMPNLFSACTNDVLLLLTYFHVFQAASNEQKCMAAQAS
jgi:hypothetical protein